MYDVTTYSICKQWTGHGFVSDGDYGADVALSLIRSRPRTHLRPSRVGAVKHCGFALSKRTLAGLACAHSHIADKLQSNSFANLERCVTVEIRAGKVQYLYTDSPFHWQVQMRKVISPEESRTSKYTTALHGGLYVPTAFSNGGV